MCKPITCELTGLVIDFPFVPEFVVVGSDNLGYAIYDSNASAVAAIAWKWSRNYPELSFSVVEM